jgi:hypothetical protein
MSKLPPAGDEAAIVLGIALGLFDQANKLTAGQPAIWPMAKAAVIATTPRVGLWRVDAQHLLISPPWL